MIEGGRKEAHISGLRRLSEGESSKKKEDIRTEIRGKSVSGPNFWGPTSNREKKKKEVGDPQKKRKLNQGGGRLVTSSSTNPKLMKIGDWFNRIA